MEKDRSKGKYLLVENIFDQTLRKVLPVNVFILREDTFEDMTFDTRFFITSDYHKSTMRIGGEFYKVISNII
jgi:hypothetical protein